MKKQWMQITSLVLNCVLIVLVFWQGARLEDLERQTDDGLEDLEQRLDMGLEEAKKQEAESAPTVRFSQVRVDTASRMLTMDVTVEGRKARSFLQTWVFAVRVSHTAYPGPRCIWSGRRMGEPFPRR